MNVSTAATTPKRELSQAPPHVTTFKTEPLTSPANQEKIVMSLVVSPKKSQQDMCQDTMKDLSIAEQKDKIIGRSEHVFPTTESLSRMSDHQKAAVGNTSKEFDEPDDEEVSI